MRLYAQSLYNAGIGFFPLRGNHDDRTTMALNASSCEFTLRRRTGTHNILPSDILGTFAATDRLSPGRSRRQSPMPTNTKVSAFTLGSNFSSPDPWSDGGSERLDYRFDFNNARFILLDQFTPME